MAPKYLGILLLLSIYFGTGQCQLTTTPNGGTVVLGQSIQISWQLRGSLCGSLLVDFCPGVQTEGCTTIAVLPASARNYQWITNRIAIGRFRIQYKTQMPIYGCRVSYSSSSFSAVFSINCQPLVVSQHPISAVALLGSSAQFSVSASGTQISYQWIFNGQPIAGALQPAYVIPSTQISNSGQYSVRVQDTCQASVTSNTATLRVCPPITIRQFSPILQAEVGSPFILQVDAYGQDLKFIWSKEDQIISRSNALNFANFQLEDYGQYTVRIEDACGQHTELQVMLYSKPFAITASPPTETFLFVGDSTLLDVQVLKGNFDVSYQWFRDGSAIRGATERSLNVTNFSLTDDGTRFTFSVSADGHTITSEPSTILAYPSPVILSILVAPEAVFPGEDVTFSVTAFGQQMQYKWLVNGVVQEDFTGLTSIQLTASSVAVNATRVVVRVTNPNGLVESDPMLLLVKNQPIFIDNEPLEYFLLLNQTATLDLTDQVIGEQISFRWLKNNDTFIQENDTTIAVQLDAAIVSTLYQLEATNPSGSTLGPMIWVHPEPAPQIIDHSESPYFYFVGDSPELFIDAAGQGVHYRWFRGTELMVAGESSQITLWPLSEQNNLLTMRGEAYNINGFSSSVNITLQLEPAPIIVQQMPTPLSVFLNDTAVLSVQAEGSDLEFRWRLVPALRFNVLPSSMEGTSTIEVPQVVTRFYANVIVQNPSGSVTSNTAHILIHAPPAFVGGSRTIIPIVINTTTILKSTAVGAGVTYTWSINDTIIISNTVQDAFQLTNIGMQYNGTYVRVIASNPSGSVSAESMLIIVTKPALQTPLQPLHEVLISTTFTIDVNSSGYDVLYEWRHNDTWFTNSTGPLEIKASSFNMSGKYQLYMHNLAGTTGPFEFRLVVVHLQAETLNATTVDAFEGDSLLLAVSLSTQNYDVLNFQWRLSKEPIEGAYATSLRIANVSAEHGGHYTIHISHKRNPLSYVDRSVTTISILGGPVLQQPIYHQPLYDVQAGNNVTLSALVTKDERMKYQWYRNDKPIEGETGRTLTFEASYSMSGDQITVTLSNPADSKTSDPVYLRVRFSDVAIAMIVVFAGGALIAGVIFSIVLVRRKINKQRQISFNKATYGTEDFKYKLLPPWKAPVDSKLATRLDLLPVIFSKTSLTFGATNFNVQEEYTDTIDVKWQGGLKLAISTLHQNNKRTSLKPDLNIPLLDITSKKSRSFTVIFHPPRTTKLNFTAHPDEIGLDYQKRLTRFSVHDDSTSDETVQFKLELNVSLSVTALIGVEMPEIGKHFYIPCDIVAGPSVWIDIDEIETDPVPVGNGSYGVVHKGQYKGRTVAVKKLIMQEGLDPKSLEEFEREIQFLSELRNPGIVSLIGASKLPGKLAIVTEFIANGSLEKWMTKKLPYATKLQIALEVGKAIDYLHKNGVLHRDIKAENVLVESLDVNSPNMTRLSDFGSARRFMEDKMETFTKGVGTPIYMAPEVLTNKKYSKEADIYSFGILLWVIITQKEPYTAFTHSWDVSNFVLSGQREVIPAGCPPDYAELITGCWAQEPQERMPVPLIIEKLDKMLKEQFEMN